MTNHFRNTAFWVLFICCFFKGYSQVQLNSADTDIFLMDTLMIAPSQLAEIGTLDLEIQKTLSFKNKEDGFKIYHYITGEIHSKGLIQELLPEGEWIIYHKNGQVMKQITFKDGVEHGVYTSWYDNGNLNAKGELKKGLREGKWIFLKEDGTSRGDYKYKKGKLVK